MHHAGLDFVDLRQLIRGALQTNNDVQMIEVLQVGKEEMPEAIKTLQMMLAITQEKCSSYRRCQKGGRLIGYLLQGCTRLRRWRGGRRL
jgi:hypothetical protein